MNQRTFGRKTEKVETMNQLTLDDYMDDIFNEPEAMSDDSKEGSSYTFKTKTKREEKSYRIHIKSFITFIKTA